MRALALRLFLRVVQVRDRLALRRLQRRHPGLRIDPTASTNLAVARFELARGAELHVGPGVVTERRRGELCFHVDEGGRIEIGEGTWLRIEVQAIRLVAFGGATLRLGRECFLNGCQLSAKRGVDVGEGAMIGPGTRVYDSDQHPIDLATPDGSRIPIEQRAAREVTHLGTTQLTPTGASVWNPAFDVTPATLVTGIITERGIARAPYGESLRGLVENSADE